ncbi:MAG TPA: phage holin family protein [Candidatus Methylacidiphilales bacterium]|nr:phage holin family protein [Candidatus Methylacidiphilales bacterium]
MLTRFVWHWLILSLALYLITLVPFLGIHFDSYGDLAWAALVLIVANTIVKPLLILISLPLVLLTLGLFLFVINAIILYALPGFVHGFHVPNFWAAFWGSLLLSVITSLFTGYERRAMSYRRQVRSVRRGSGDVIDI